MHQGFMMILGLFEGGMDWLCGEWADVFVAFSRATGWPNGTFAGGDWLFGYYVPTMDQEMNCQAAYVCRSEQNLC